jgi:hypothetical protein
MIRNKKSGNCRKKCVAGQYRSRSGRCKPIGSGSIKRSSAQTSSAKTSSAQTLNSTLARLGVSLPDPYKIWNSQGIMVPGKNGVTPPPASSRHTTPASSQTFPKKSLSAPPLVPEWKPQTQSKPSSEWKLSVDKSKPLSAPPLVPQWKPPTQSKPKSSSWNSIKKFFTHKSSSAPSSSSSSIPSFIQKPSSEPPKKLHKTVQDDLDKHLAFVKKHVTPYV